MSPAVPAAAPARASTDAGARVGAPHASTGARARVGLGFVAGVAALSLFALWLRVVRLDEPVLRWDEGWSIAHATLDWRDLVRVATLDWHPPLYAAALKVWIALAGKSVYAVRYFSVLGGVLAVPLAAAAAREWARVGSGEDGMDGRSPRRWRAAAPEAVGLFAALFAAAWPLLVYYGQVARMYPLAVAGVLLAAYGAARVVRGGESERSGWWINAAAKAGSRSAPQGRPHPSPLPEGEGTRDAKLGAGPSGWMPLAAGTALAMYALYYNVWPLAAIYFWVLVVRPRRLPWLVVAGAAALVAYAPWIPAALDTFLARGGTGVVSIERLWGFLAPTFDGLAFTYGTERAAAGLLVLALVVGALAGRWRRADMGRLLLPVLVVGIAGGGLAYGAARADYFAVRHLAPVAPFVGLALGWALARVWRWQPVGAAALVAAVAVGYWPTATSFVYAKTLEVVDPFDPTADYRYLAERSRPDDLVVFNVLHPAGWYEQLRRPEDPVWTYAMRWDPIVEPMERVAAQLAPRLTVHERVWFALYKGAVGPNGELVDWLDEHPGLYPAGGGWREDTWFRRFVAPRAPMAERLTHPVQGAPGTRRLGPFRLEAARLTERARPGGAIAVELRWSTERPEGNYKVFVHVLDGSGRLVGQHDGVPAGERRPTGSWSAGEAVVDRHGVVLPPDASGEMRVRVGLYDPSNGRRLAGPDGADGIDLGVVAVGAGA